MRRWLGLWLLTFALELLELAMIPIEEWQELKDIADEKEIKGTS